MCAPLVAALPYIYAAAAVASTAIAVNSAQNSRKAANQQADYQGQVAANNAITAGYEGDYAREATELKTAQHRLQVSQMVGKQRGAMGATGIVVDQGSFMDLTLDTVEQGKLDELAILHEGDKAVWRSNIEGGNFSAQSGMYAASKSSPTLAAAPALMSGLSNAGLNYYNMTDKMRVPETPTIDTTKGDWSWA